jgi:hypothetical protein
VTLNLIKPKNAAENLLPQSPVGPVGPLGETILILNFVSQKRSEEVFMRRQADSRRNYPPHMFAKVKVKKRPLRRAKAKRDGDLDSRLHATAIVLACHIALKTDTCHERFRFAWDAAKIRLGTLRELALRLDVHPSSLTRTNFKLSAQLRRTAAEEMGVAPGFLAAGATAAGDLPEALRAPLQVAVAILAFAKCPGPGQTVAWTHEAALINLRPAALRSKLVGHDGPLITAVHRALAKHAAQRLKRSATITLPLSDWSAIIDQLISDTLADAPENLQHPRMQLACQLHRCLADKVQA